MICHIYWTISWGCSPPKKSGSQGWFRLDTILTGPSHDRGPGMVLDWLIGTVKIHQKWWFYQETLVITSKNEDWIMRNSGLNMCTVFTGNFKADLMVIHGFRWNSRCLVAIAQEGLVDVPIEQAAKAQGVDLPWWSVPHGGLTKKSANQHWRQTSMLHVFEPFTIVATICF